MNYVRPQALHHWCIDVPGEERYEVSIMNDGTVLSASGRYAQGSGATSVSWNEFLDGRLQELVRETMGEEIFAEVLSKLRSLTADG